MVSLQDRWGKTSSGTSSPVGANPASFSPGLRPIFRATSGWLNHPHSDPRDPEEAPESYGNQRAAK